MNDFLPSGYVPPTPSGRYMKLQKGENRFRVLGSAIVGHEFWTERDGKRSPQRRPMGHRITTDELEEGGGQAVKHFWAFLVWDYSDGSVKVLELTQKGLQKEITALVQDEDWGDPKQYDLSVVREGDGMETTYTVKPKPAKPLSEEQQAALKETQEAGFDINELFTGGDPFAPAPKAPAPAAKGKAEKIDYVTGEIHIDDIAYGGQE